jgi:hypothetical protein
MELGLEGFDWMYLAQDKYRWRALVEKTLTFCIKRREIVD